MGILRLNYDILLCIVEYLSSKDFCMLSQCNRYLYQLQMIADSTVWKRFCLQDFFITYNHPDQTYRQLYFQCKNVTICHHKRLPCHHLTETQQTVVLEGYSKTFKDLVQCQQCFVTGVENLFICISPHCYHLVCDRHARHHTRLTHKDKQHHALFYKPNMSELFCQLCVDWIGSHEADRAEQHQAQLITEACVHHLHSAETSTTLSLSDIRALKSIRQYERQLRWKDTPQRIMNNPAGFCFISSSWMAEWEMFVEGWKTKPPIHVQIDQTKLLTSIASQLNTKGINLFHLNSFANVMIISNDTWEYLSCHYKIKGKQITEGSIHL
ncbi:MAG: hypothetical protein EXX96DRAFT_80919 [Benjaminiella poitrasii]|nr:MAG: hypothetical protein EXX96DRAFT_80919 [Benjaminiella poitrasii]